MQNNGRVRASLLVCGLRAAAFLAGRYLLPYNHSPGALPPGVNVVLELAPVAVENGEGAPLLIAHDYKPVHSISIRALEGRLSLEGAEPEQAVVIADAQRYGDIIYYPPDNSKKTDVIVVEFYSDSNRLLFAKDLPVYWLTRQTQRQESLSPELPE